MTKKVIVFIVTFLYGLDKSSLNIGNTRIPLFHFSVILLTITIFIEYFVIKKEYLEFIKDVLERFLNKNRYSLFVMATWFTYALLSYRWVQSIPHWHQAIRFFIVGIFCTIALILFLRTKKDIHQVFQIMGITAIIHNIIGWYEVLTQNHLFTSHRWGNRPVSLFYNTNNFGTFLFFSVFILYALGENCKNVSLKIIYKATAASSTLLIYFTQSRGTQLGLAFGLVILITLSNADKLKNIRKPALSKRLLPAFLTTSTIKIVAILVYMLTIGIDESNSVRVNLIRNGLVFLRQTNGFGVGAGNLEYWLEANLYFVSPINNPPEIHNWWMEILAGYGVVIFLLYVVFYYRLLRDNFLKLLKSNTLIDKSFSKAMICIMGGFLIVSAVPDTLIPHLFHWVFWAVVIAFQGVAVEEY